MPSAARGLTSVRPRAAACAFDRKPRNQRRGPQKPIFCRLAFDLKIQCGSVC